MLARLFTAAVNGLNACPVEVQVDVRPGSEIRMVGLPDSAVRESITRIFPALKNSDYHYPGGMHTVVNLAPADLRKEGTGYDLPIALGMLAAIEAVDASRLPRFIVVGELGLDGALRPIRGALPIAIKARQLGYEGLIVPQENVREAAVVNQLHVYGADHLRTVVDFFNGKETMQPTEVNTREEFFAKQREFPFDFAEVRGQEPVKRALEVAAAGGHNVLLIGSPGCGKSMMAKRLPSILPPLSLAESLETTQIHSVAGKLGQDSSLIATRPFRSPHHTISDVALIGGGSNFQPGEISLAHHGVLFMDELPEFSRSALETLRQPLEDRRITVSRAKYTIDLPCSFMLVASMNPCPCGYYNHPTRRCACLPGQIQRYMNKVSGPLLDRIDIQVMVTPVPFSDLSQAPEGASSHTIRERVVAARHIQEQRFANEPHVHCNAQMTSRMLQTFAQPDPSGYDRLQTAMKRLDLSARAYERILKVARTIADLEGAPTIQTAHIAEAIGYRNLDRGSWGE